MKKKEPYTGHAILAASTATNGYSYSCDSIGNSVYAVRNLATNLYMVNALNQYASVTGAGGAQSLTYDANGHQKSAKPKAMPPGDRDFIAAPQGRSEERYPATQRQLYVTAYVSETGAVVAEYEYDAFGNTITQSGSLSDSFRHRFSTKPWIAALGVYDYGERVYSPELRRWLSRDPIGEAGGVNLYAMCGNDAVNGFDYWGREVFSEKGKTSTETVVNNCEYHVWNCIEFNYKGTKNEYVKHFLSYTFNHPKIPKGVRRLLAYNLVSGLGLDKSPKSCWSVNLEPIQVTRDEQQRSKPKATYVRIRLEATPTFLERHKTCCERPAEKMALPETIVVTTPFQREEDTR